MRAAAILLTLAALAGCRERPGPSGTAPKPSHDAVTVALEADYPRVMFADPEATNYAPPDWPLEPGDRITRDQYNRLLSKHSDDYDWGDAVVWVVGESGPAGAIPFGAWFTTESGLLPGEPEVERRAYMNGTVMAVLLGWPPRGTETMLWQGQRSFSLMVPSSPERNMAQGASRDPAVLTRPA